MYSTHIVHIGKMSRSTRDCIRTPACSRYSAHLDRNNYASGKDCRGRIALPNNRKRSCIDIRCSKSTTRKGLY